MVTARARTTITLSAPPEQIDRFRVVRQIGMGAMGTVFAGVDTTTGQDVALKVVHGYHAITRVFCERLKREARAMALIRHPNVVRVVASGGHEGGLAYLAMELVEGVTLAALLADRRPLPPVRAGRIALGIARGLAAVHLSGFVHRDLKPGNVMITRGATDAEGVKILDFGIVSSLNDPSTRLTQDGVVLGTPAYMAPEQVVSSEVGAPADLYALGVILFEMLAGFPPFEGDFHQVAVRQMLQKPPVLPPCGGLEALVARLLEKDPPQRPRSAGEVARELALVLARI